MLLTTSYAFRIITRHVSRSLGKTCPPQLVRKMATNPKAAEPISVERHNIIRNGEHFTEIKEGMGRILIPVSAKDDTKKDSQSEEEQQKVFYNPIQQFNRDLTVLAIKAYGEDIITKRRAAIENKVNKKKRKRSDIEDGRSKKQGSSSGPADDGAAAAVTANGEAGADKGEAMDISEPPNEQHAIPVASISGPTIETETSKGDAGSSQIGESAMSLEHKTHDEIRQRKLDPPHFTILDALSATGLRALRYVQELPFVTSVTANDLTPAAVEAIQRNVEHNGVESKVRVTQGDARAHMYSLIAGEITDEHEKNPRHYPRGRAAHTKKYDVIDLDPYGTAATFFDAAIHAVRDDGGLLCVTCTDSGVWASHGYPEKAFALYGGIPVKGFFCHEVGLRLVLNSLASSAARHGLVIEPLLSLSIDYYLRIFVRIKKSPASVKFLAGKTMVVYNCDQGCGSWETQLLARNKKVANNKGSGVYYKHGLSQGPSVDQLCKHCGTKMHLAGPMYAGPLHSPEFIERILADLPNASTDVYGTTTRIEGMLRTALEEFIPPPPDSQPSIKEDVLAAVEPYPFYFHPTILAGRMHCTCPDEDSLRGALRGLGYEVTRSHCKPGSIRTNAPWPVLWHVMREWIRQKAPVKRENIKQGSAAYKLLRLDRENAPESKDEDEVDKLEVVFNQSLGKDNTSKKGLVRYQMNPKENWGPLSKAKGH